MISTNICVPISANLQICWFHLFVTNGCLICRMSLPNNKYRVIKLPISIADGRHTRCNLGKSKHDLYFTAIRVWYDLRVWILDDSCCQPQWVLKHENDLEASTLLTVSRMSYLKQIDVH